MTSRSARAFLMLAAATLALLTSCTSSAPTIQPGTNAFHWAAAQQTFRQGDLARTQENLNRLVRSDNEYRTRAQVWLMVVSSGLADGYAELADNYEIGARMNRNNPGAFRKQTAVLRSAASQTALQMTETVHEFLQQNQDAMIPLAFDEPPGAAAEPAQLARIGKGLFPPAAEADLLQRAMLQRSVLLAVARATGNRADAAKARELFRQPPVTVPRGTFVTALAGMLFEHAELYSPMKLDQPVRVALLCREAVEALATVPATKETKELRATIEKTMKRVKIAPVS